MSDLVMREATDADLPAIIAMLADDINGAKREDASLPLEPGYLLAFAAIDADPNQMLVVAELHGKPVGTLQLSFLPGLSFKGKWRGQIEAVRISSGLRGHGLGARLIGWAVDQCKARGCSMAQLTSKADRLDAHRFYERLGWSKTHVGYKLQLQAID